MSFPRIASRFAFLLVAAGVLVSASPGPEHVAGFVGSFRVLGSLQQGNLKIVAIRGGSRSGTPVATLDEALPAGKVTIRETAGGGSVNTLVLHNHGDRAVFILAGEILVGAKQDRILQQDVLLPANGQPVQVPAFCVEHGRWREQSAAFYSEKAAAPIAVRQAAQASRNQSVVWEEVAANNADIAAGTATGSLSATYKAGRVAESRKAFLDALSRLPRNFPTAAGVVVLVNGRVAGADLFQDPSTFTRLWGKLLDSYIAEAVRREGREPVGDLSSAEDYLRKASAARSELRLSPGVGQRISLDGEGLKGSGIALEGPVHLDIFPAVERAAGARPRLQRDSLHRQELGRN